MEAAIKKAKYQNGAGPMVDEDINKLREAIMSLADKETLKAVFALMKIFTDRVEELKADYRMHDEGLPNYNDSIKLRPNYTEEHIH